MFVIQILSLANGTRSPFDGGFVKTFDPDAFNGRGDLDVVMKAKDARKFDTQVEALRFWQQQSTVKPTRADGKPNRPLTAFNVTIEPYPEGSEGPYKGF